MGHADIKTTMVYTHYAPGANEAKLVNGVFEPSRTNGRADAASAHQRAPASSAEAPEQRPGA